MLEFKSNPLAGALGISASAVTEATLPTIDQVNEGAGLITQLVILVVTIISFFKKKKVN